MSLSQERQVGADHAAELLARDLYETMEWLAPTDDEGEWDKVSEYDKEYYRTCIERLLQRDDLIQVALLD